MSARGTGKLWNNPQKNVNVIAQKAHDYFNGTDKARCIELMLTRKRECLHAGGGQLLKTLLN